MGRFYVATLALALWVMGGLLSPLAYSQTKRRGDDLGRGAVEDALRDSASRAVGVDQRSEEERLRAEAERLKSIEDLGTSPASQAQVVQPEVDPARVDELLKEVESKNRSLVEQYEALLNKDPTNAKAPEWLFRIAEYKWEISSYRHLRDMREWVKETEVLDARGLGPEDWPPAPMPNYTDAIEYYRRIVSSFENYDRLDEVLFKLGDGLIRAGQAKEGVGYLHRLTQSYPDSRYLDLVYLAMGEYYFETRNIGTAQAAYEKIVDNYPDSRVFNYALYKLAWTHLNTGDEEGFRMAVETFKRVVETLDAQFAEYVDDEGILDENRLPLGEVSFRNQAINDMIVAYAELEGGWQEGRDYFARKLNAERLRQKMEMFGELMGSRGVFQERVAIYRWLIGTDPVHHRIPEYAERIIDSYFNMTAPEMIETVTREFIDYFEPNGKWALVNVNHETAYVRARQFAEDKLYSLAATYLIDATKAVDRNDESEANRLFAQARRDHEVFLSRYPESAYAYDMNFYYAYILDENSDRSLTKLKRASGSRPEEFRRVARETILPDLKAAAEQYQRVIEMRGQQSEEEEDHTRVSANRQVFVYANILATVDPGWSIEASGSARNFTAEKKDSEVKDAEPLTEPENDFVKSAGQYAGLFPTHEDTPGFLWRSAEIYRSRNHYNEAAQRFDDLVTNFPQHEYAGQAVGSMFALYNKAENWPKIEYWAEWLIAQKNFKVYSLAELEDAVGYSIGQQAKDLYEAKVYKDAAEKLYTLKARFPERESLVAPAIMGTADIYRDGKMVAMALQTYEEFRGAYPHRPEAAIATWEAATLYAQKTDFERAAELFEVLPDEVAALDARLSGTPAGADKGKKGAKVKAAARAEGAAVESDDEIMAKNRTHQFMGLFNAIQLREGLHEWDRAVANARRYLEMNPDGSGDVYDVGGELMRAKDAATLPPGAQLLVNREGTDFHLAELLLRAGRVDEAMSQYRTYLTTYSGNRPAQVQGRLALARVYAERKDLKGLERELAEAETLITSAPPELQERLAPGLAELRFLRAERKFDEFKEVKLEFPERVLRRRVDEKMKIRDEAEKLYTAVSDVKIAGWTAAAACRIGEMALDFRDSFRNLPIPAEIRNDPDREADYIAWVEDEIIYPFEDVAIKRFEYALDIAHQLRVYNQWSRRSAQRMSELQPNAFPVTNEPGVATEHLADVAPRGDFVGGIAERGPRSLEERPSEAAEEVAPAPESGAMERGASE